VRRWLVVTAALATLAVVCVGAWAALGRGGAGGTAAPKGNAPGVSAAPTGAASGGAASGGTASGSAASGGAASASPSPHASLIPLPRGVHHLAAAPAPRMIARPRRLPVPILMYHLIGNPPAGEPYPDLFVSLSDFVAQMRYLEAHHFSAVTLGQLVAFWHGKGKLPAKPVVLSFDDGYRSDWVDATPILQRLGWRGVLNLCLNAVRPHGDLPAPVVRAMVHAGWEVGDHTLTHPDLTTLDGAGLHREIVVSRARLRALTGQPVSFFCYPSGAYDAKVIAAVKAAGFKGATTTNYGLAAPTDLFTLARIRVHRGVSMSDFAKALGG
jgi:peptidoglycan/xylan/chitin deacetylase (PgdA/CDA1 family)